MRTKTPRIAAGREVGVPDRGSKRSLLLIGLLAALAAPLGAQAEEPADFAAQAEALVEPYAESGLFSGTILVAQDGKPLFRRAYGLANREWGAANTLDTHFRIGSLTKQFTAAAVLQLAERGKLGLDDRIREYVPGAPPAWDRVSLRHLLDHRSGIINYTALPDYLSALSRVERSPREIVALTESQPLLFEPGTQSQYSNTGYVLLGMAIEAASGQPYAAYLRDHLFSPLGLKETGYDDASAILPRRAAGYRFGQRQMRNAPPMASSIAYAAGGLYATVDDLLAWDEALFSGKVISEASREAMFRDAGGGYGFGWYVGPANGHRLWSHGGGVSGFLSMTDYYPDARLAVIVLANTETAPVQKIARELGALRFGIHDPPDPIVLETVMLDRYAGTYQVGPRFFLAVERREGRLSVRGTGQPAYPFLPESDRTFFSKVVDARITFDTEPDGHPTGLVLHQGGRDRLGPRIEAEWAQAILSKPLPSRREIALDPARFAGLVGRYDLGGGGSLVVTQEDGRLYAQASAEPRNELFAENDRDFFLKTADIQITFERDGGGRATGLVLHGGGLDTSAPRNTGDEARAGTGPSAGH